jgi:predicted secreted hydrolase
LIEAAVDFFSEASVRLRHTKAHASLPEDLFAHADVQTEWWYYTGHCETASGRRFGFELVFFKRRTDLDSIGIFPVRAIANPMYFAHFAISDVDKGEFRYEHTRSFAGQFDLPVSMSETAFDLRLGDWSIKEVDGAHVLHARLGTDTVFDAVLETGKPLVQNGDGGSGISAKTTGASAHFSFTRMEAAGKLTTGGKSESFTGTAWMDREFGTWEQTDWDWFSVQLDDGTELMIYQYRTKNGETSRDSTGTFVHRNGECSYLTYSDYQIEESATWTSPKTGTRYPSRWSITVPSLNIDVRVEPLIDDQELDTRGTTMIIYWEGACRVSGTRMGKDVTGRAYVELVGYDRSHESAGLSDFLFGGLFRRITGLVS